MKNNISRKGRVIGIMILFIGASVVPSISGNIGEPIYIEGLDYFERENFNGVADGDGFKIISHLATQKEIDEMKKQVGVYDPNRNYNIIYEGHGTGLSPPTEEEWDEMIGNIRIVELVSSSESLLSSIDLSADPCFPQVRSQGGQGSCAAWAATYYANGYIQAKDNGWTEASGGNDDQLLSPAFTYNKCNFGVDRGSHTYTNALVMRKIGVCRWGRMPYDPSDWINWGDEDAWRDAPEYRTKDTYQLFSPIDDENITAIKAAVSNGLPVTFALNHMSYGNFGTDDVLGSTAMQFNITHANTIIGYDDSKVDLETSETGAFKVVNSWGPDFGPNNNGYFWITYEAFKGLWNVYPVCWFDDLYETTVDISPKLIGVWQFNPTPDRDASIRFCIGPFGDPYDTKFPNWDGYSFQMHSYPEFMCFDITEFFDEWVAGISDFYLEIGDTEGNDGTITSFIVEYYRDNYILGNPDRVSNESPDVPKDTPGYATVSFLPPPVHNVDKNSYYYSIQDGVNDTDSGNTLKVLGNTILYENVVIDKTINLTGNVPDRPIIDGNGYGDVVKITAPWVNISGFTIQNSGAVFPNAGINVSSENNTISENDIINNPGYGVILNHGSNNLVYHNNFLNNTCNAYSESDNIWDDDYPYGGNHWDDFHNESQGAYDEFHGSNQNISGSDGIVDLGLPDGGLNPYAILGGNNQDRYPLVEPWRPPSTVYVSVEYNKSTLGWQIDHFDNIQDGIDAVAEHGTVYVFNGTYYENVILEKTIKLIGEDRNTTRIDANGIGNVVHISADSVDISGFSIQNSGNEYSNAGIHVDSDKNNITGNVIHDNHFGIYIASTHNNNITNNNITDNIGGIHLDRGSAGCEIINNTIIKNENGVKLHSSASNRVSGNGIINNSENGIYLYFSSNNYILGNTIACNNKGLYLTDSMFYNPWVGSCNNHIIGNVIADNSYGINISSVGSSQYPSDNNCIYHNNFINNNQHAYDEWNNTWNNSYPSSGNYWHNYTVDDDYHGSNQNIPGPDNIGDKQYNISGDNNMDYYPLIKPWGFQVKGYCYYQNMSQVNNLTIEIINLNTSQKWYAGTNNNYYSLVLAPGEDINVGDTLRLIARDDNESVNVTNHMIGESDIDNKTIHINPILDIHYRDLKDFPLYKAEANQSLGYTENMVCGAAVAQMVLSYIHWNSSQYPVSPLMPPFDNQTWLYERCQENNSNTSLPYIDSRGMQRVLIQLAQYNEPLPYCFIKQNNINYNEILKQICIWIDFTVEGDPLHYPNFEGHPKHVPAAVPAYGNYSNWMAIRGIHTNRSGWDGEEPVEELTVYGFWINDPYHDGIGKNTYKTVDEWNTTYYFPLDVPDDPHNGEYIAIVDPPADYDRSKLDDIKLTAASSPARFNSQEARMVEYARTNSDATELFISMANKAVVDAAVEGLSEILMFDEELAALFEKTTAGKPLYVRNLVDGNDYYLVPFNTGTSAASFVVRVGAHDGRFLEFSYVEEPVNYLGELCINRDREHTHLVYTGSSSPYYPLISQDW